MLFDEDTTLLSFFENYSDPEDEDELKENIIKYVGGGNFGGAPTISEENTTGESLDDVSKILLIKFLADFLSIRLSSRHEEKEETSYASGREIIGRC